MGLFGYHRSPSKATLSKKKSSLSRAALPRGGSKLSDLFTEEDPQDANSRDKGMESKPRREVFVPTVSLDDFTQKKYSAQIGNSPPLDSQSVVQNGSPIGLKGNRVDRPIAIDKRLLDERGASSNADSMSMSARRNSIKHSISRKIARSESRRQMLRISDTSLMGIGDTTITSQSSSAAPLDQKFPKQHASTSKLRTLVHEPMGWTSSPMSKSNSFSNHFRVSDSKGQSTSSKSDEDDDILMDLDAMTLTEEIGEYTENKVINPYSKTRSSAATQLDSSGKEEIAKTASFRKGNEPNLVHEYGKETSTKPQKRPPPLMVGENASSFVDSTADWPSGKCFGSDGGFTTGGFRITSEGMLDKPLAVTREDSELSDAGDFVVSIRALVIVRGLNEFRIGRTIGAGAAGRVYLADHVPSKKPMAIKMVNVYEKERRNQLLKELETLSNHVSRYLVRFYGAFYDGSGAVHIALEYMDHGCLATFIQRVGAIPEPIVKLIAHDCVKGLRFLHRHHVLHRDIKTGNILLSRRLCCAKLSDFGLARDLNVGVSRVDTFVGTVAYMSPERLDGNQYTYASDIWALGVSILECLMGRYPFDRPQNYFEFIEATVASNVFRGLDKASASFSGEARDFVAMCTNVDPKKRATCVELLEHPWLRDLIRDNNMFGSWLDECRVLSMREKRHT